MDIIILAIIAVFVALRLRSVLGKQTGFDLRQSPGGLAPKRDERVIQLPERLAPKEEDPVLLAKLEDAGLSQALASMRNVDADFTAGDFLAGARAAYDMAFDAFRKGERGPLKMLMSPEIYREFDQAIKTREAAEEKPEITLVSISDAAVAGAELAGSLARITVRFNSEQIHIARDRDGKIASGDPSQIHHAEDIWVFERDLKSKNPNWSIVAT